MNNPFAFLFICLLFIFSDLQTVIAQSPKQEINFSLHKCLPGYGFKKMGNTAIFQGNKKRKNYFEGWYFKMVSANDSSILSVIPGISLPNDKSKQHAFVQIIDGRTAKAYYYSFPIEQFSFSRKEFAIKIGENYFSNNQIILNIQNDSSSVSGVVNMSNPYPFSRKKMIDPGIMGWYRFVPFMQCYHGVVSLTHKLNGNIDVNGKVLNFDKGTGYIEKDWGSSMPLAWIWIESNNFSHENSSFMLSVANIPWLGKSFTGFLGFFLHDSTLYKFATYTHARLQLEKLVQDSVYITISDKHYNYSIKAYRNNAGMLKAPVKGSMDRRIPESIDAILQLTVMDRQNNIVFHGSTSVTGFEMVGDMDLLRTLLKVNKQMK